MKISTFSCICCEIKNVAIYALHRESCCLKNLAIQKVFDFSDSEVLPQVCCLKTSRIIRNCTLIFSDHLRAWVKRVSPAHQNTLTPFLAVQTRVWDSSLPTPVTHSLTHSLQTYKDLLLFDIQSDPRAMWPFRHLIRVMRRYDLTKKRQWQRQRQRQWQIHSESTFKERFQRIVTFATFDQSDLETLPDQKERQLQWQIQRQRQRQIHLESTLKEQS